METIKHSIVEIIAAFLVTYSKLFTCFYNWLWYSNFTMSLSIGQKDWQGLLLCIALPHPFVFGLEILSWRLLMLKFRIWSTTTKTKVCQTRLDLTWIDLTRLDLIWPQLNLFISLLFQHVQILHMIIARTITKFLKWKQVVWKLSPVIVLEL